jgi:hypothetical protein
MRFCSSSCCRLYKEECNKTIHKRYCDSRRGAISYYSKKCVVCGDCFVTEDSMSEQCADCKSKLKEQLKPRLSQCKPPQVTYKKICDECAKPFVTIVARQRFCNQKCGLSFHNKLYHQTKSKKRSKSHYVKKCVRCYEEFTTKYHHQKVCGDCSIKKKAPKIPVGWYVYGWFHSEEMLPFYIGKGIGRRAWDVHNGDYYLYADCQKERTSNTIVKILRENLTEEGALLCESILIDSLREFGVLLTNRSNGIKRPEVLPLELPNMNPGAR